MSERSYRVEVYVTCNGDAMRVFREKLDELGNECFNDWDFYVMDASTGDEIEYGDE